MVRTIDLRLEPEEIKTLQMIEPPLDFLGLDFPQALYDENRTNIPSDVCTA